MLRISSSTCPVTVCPAEGRLSSGYARGCWRQQGEGEVKVEAEEFGSCVGLFLCMSQFMFSSCSEVFLYMASSRSVCQFDSVRLRLMLYSDQSDCSDPAAWGRERERESVCVLRASVCVRVYYYYYLTLKTLLQKFLDILQNFQKSWASSSLPAVQSTIQHRDPVNVRFRIQLSCTRLHFSGIGAVSCMFFKMTAIHCKCEESPGGWRQGGGWTGGGRGGSGGWAWVIY